MFYSWEKSYVAFHCLEFRISTFSNKDIIKIKIFMHSIKVYSKTLKDKYLFVKTTYIFTTPKNFF